MEITFSIKVIAWVYLAYQAILVLGLPFIFGKGKEHKVYNPEEWLQHIVVILPVVYVMWKILSV